MSLGVLGTSYRSNYHFREGVKLMSVCPWAVNTGLLQTVMLQKDSSVQECVVTSIAVRNENWITWIKKSCTSVQVGVSFYIGVKSKKR